MIDVYCLTCYFFVVLVMAEYAVVLLLNERVKKEKIFIEEKKVSELSFLIFCTRVCVCLLSGIILSTQSGHYFRTNKNSHENLNMIFDRLNINFSSKIFDLTRSNFMFDLMSSLTQFSICIYYLTHKNTVID